MTKFKTREQAIAAGLDFLARSPWELDFVYLYSYLQPKFAWPDLPVQDRHAEIQDSLKVDGGSAALGFLDQMTLFQRLVDPDFKLPAEKVALGQNEDTYTVVALYCDHLKPDSATYFPQLRKAMTAGYYGLTHALLSYLWIEEHGCFSVTELDALHRQLVAENQNLVDQITGWDDLKLEAVALLQAVGVLTSRRNIDEIVLLQQADGGWLHDPMRNRSSTHATILALWILAGYR